MSPQPFGGVFDEKGLDICTNIKLATYVDVYKKGYEWAQQLT